MEIILLIILVGAAILKLRIKYAPQKQETVKDINRDAAKRNQQTRQNNTGYQKTSRQVQPNQQTKPNNQKPNPNIVDRAKLNTAANLPDALKSRDRQMHNAAGPYIMVNHELDTSQLMKQVSDLMVTGYSGKLEFDRDFIAEGVDMLNKIQG